MKRLCALLITILLLLCTACASEAPQATEPTETTKIAEVVFTEDLVSKLDEAVQNSGYEGIVYLTYKGEPVYQYVSGSNDLGQPLTIDSRMYVGSVSKQFCATAVLILRDQGKLSLDDTLEKYFPEYTVGKDITLKQMLSMRSGIVRDMPAMWLTPELYENNTPEENEAAFKEWVFSQPLDFTPDTACAYSNVNYSLLSLIVEMVSGVNYEDFIRQNIYEPVGMTHSGFITEVRDNPQWGLTFERIDTSDRVHIIAQGAGGIVSTGADMNLFLSALQSGRLVSMESFREMTTDHSPKLALENYGYGLSRGIRNSWGHGGANGSYTSRADFNEEYGFNLFVATGNTPVYCMGITDNTANAIIEVLFDAVDAASA